MKKLKTIIAEVLSVQESQVQDSVALDTFEEMDSFNGLLLVSEIEKNYKVSFTTEEVTNTKIVKDIKNVLERHGVSKDDI